MQKRYITIIVTVYNIAEYLDRFFEHLGQQTFTDYEVLLIDDGSTDDSLSVCKKYAEQDDRIRLVTVDHIGISSARNMAMGMLRTEFATSLDGDDFFGKDYLKHLIDAQKKYDADMVISNVIYNDEHLRETRRFSKRKEAFYPRSEFSEIVPALLDEERLNYLYGKIYRSRILKDVRVEPDVMQGSDTMINLRYLITAQSIAVIEDYDYTHIAFSKRSVTSYVGDDSFNRLYRINSDAYCMMEKGGYLSDEGIRVVDGRILISGLWSVNDIARSADPRRKKRKKATLLISSDQYMTSYMRQKERGNLDSYGFNVLHPGDEIPFVDRVCDNLAQRKKEDKIVRFKAKFPPSLRRLYRKLRGHE